jgi:hypothetical protein
VQLFALMLQLKQVIVLLLVWLQILVLASPVTR